MDQATTALGQVVPEQPAEQVGKRHFLIIWQRLALGGVILISIFMNFFQLGQSGFANLYYAAGVRSMLDCWHNFFFVSFDPGGFVTIDKPPLGFWLQVASAWLFGFTPFSIFLPQALAGVLSVILLYYLVRRHFGVIAGLLSALALALSPISVVTNHNNTIDSVLALTLLLGAWAVLRAAETGRLRWLLLCAVIVGIGFNIKMLEAYLVVPAFGLLYLLAAPHGYWKRIGHLSLAAVLLLSISLSWAVAVDLTPASQRPYVGSSQDNSEISLAFGYNGIDRLLGMFGRGRRGAPNVNAIRDRINAGSNGARAAGAPPTGGFERSFGTRGNGTTQPQSQQRPPGAGGGGFFDTGKPSPLRLFTEALGEQIAWFLPLAILGMLALAWQRRPRFQSDHQQQSLILWGAWLLTMGVFFSVAGFFHQYYLTEMAPAIAALFGIGIVTMWHDYRRGGWRGWLLPLAFIVTALEQIYLVSKYPEWAIWLIPPMAFLCALGVVALIAARLIPVRRIAGRLTRLLMPAMGVAILSLLLAPTVWAAIPVINNTAMQLPAAGPTHGNGGMFAFAPAGTDAQRLAEESTPGEGFGRNGGEGASADPALIRYLESNQGSSKFLVATPSSNSADALILATNKPVMAMGGFSGGDPILTTSQLSGLVADGTVRFFLLQGAPQQGFLEQALERIPEQYRDFLEGGFGGFGGAGQQGLSTWVTQHCTAVPSNLWQSSSHTTQNTRGPFGAGELYDCATSR